MIEPRLLTGFPLIPPFAAIIAIAAAATRRDISRRAVIAAIGLQLVAGLWLAITATRGIGWCAVLGDTPLAIEFAFGPERVPLMLAYLLPLTAAAARLDQFATPSQRLLLLLYMGGCSGLIVIVTADLFNFFVFYELIVMAAYVLVGTKGRFYASIKYMLFGALSSVSLLGGIVLLYTTGAGFRDPLAPAFLAADPLHQRWTLLLLASAYLLKSAFVPAWTWLLTCQSAAPTPVSSLLGSFTVMAGLWGLQNRVLEPAAAAGFEDVRLWIEMLAAATVVIPALFSLVEADPKRCVVASAVVSAGLIGWLMSRGHSAEAMLYIAVHAAGNTLMFHALEETRTNGRFITLRRRSAVAFAIGAVLALGLCSTPIGVWKIVLADAVPGAGILVAAATTFTLAGLLKFGMRRGGPAPPPWLPVSATLALALTIAVGMGLGMRTNVLARWTADAATLATAIAIGRALHRRPEAWDPA